MSRRSRSAALLAAVTLTASLLAPASAAQRGEDPSARKQHVDRQVATLRDDLDESTAAMRGAVAAYDQANAQLPAAREAVAQARGRVAAAQVRDSAAREALGAARSAERAATRRVGAAYDAVRSTQQAVGAVARLAYQQGPMGGLAVALEAQTPEDFSSRLSTVHTVLERENASLSQLRDQRATLALREAQLAAARQRAADRRTEAASQLLHTQQAEQTAVSAQQQVAALAAQRASAVDAAKAAKTADLHRYRLMQAEQDRLARVIRARAAAAARQAAAERARAAREAAARAAAARSRASAHRHHSTQQAHRRSHHVAPSRLFIYPVIGPITSPFGYRYHPILHYRKLHTGVDFGVAEGTPVHASRGGRVIEADFNVAYGYRTVIDHDYIRGEYLATTYDHQSRLDVHVGQYVSQGQLIGYSGNTGWSTGPHLHFEVLVNGGFVDPMGWL